MDVGDGEGVMGGGGGGRERGERERERERERRGGVAILARSRCIGVNVGSVSFPSLK